MKCPKCKRELRAAIATVPTDDKDTHFQVTVGDVCPFCKVIVWRDMDLEYLKAKNRTTTITEVVSNEAVKA